MVSGAAPARLVLPGRPVAPAKRANLASRVRRDLKAARAVSDREANQGPAVRSASSDNEEFVVILDRLAIPDKRVPPAKVEAKV